MSYLDLRSRKYHGPKPMKSPTSCNSAHKFWVQAAPNPNRVFRVSCLQGPRDLEGSCYRSSGGGFKIRAKVWEPAACLKVLGSSGLLGKKPLAPHPTRSPHLKALNPV